MTTKEILLGAADAARILRVTPAAVRMMQKRGELLAAMMTEGGMHLYRRKDVEQLAIKRQQRRSTGGR